MLDKTNVRKNALFFSFASSSSSQFSFFTIPTVLKFFTIFTNLKRAEAQSSSL